MSNNEEVVVKYAGFPVTSTSWELAYQIFYGDDIVSGVVLKTFTQVLGKERPDIFADWSEELRRDTPLSEDDTIEFQEYELEVLFNNRR